MPLKIRREWTYESLDRHGALACSWRKWCCSLSVMHMHTTPFYFLSHCFSCNWPTGTIPLPSPIFLNSFLPNAMPTIVSFASMWNVEILPKSSCNLHLYFCCCVILLWPVLVASSVGIHVNAGRWCYQSDDDSTHEMQFDWSVEL